MRGSSQLFLFQCGDTDRYALSLDPTGCNIPRHERTPPWLLRGDFSEAIKLAEFEEPIHEVARRGYCLLVVQPEKQARMKARPPIDTASFEPELLKALGQAFDGAWASIAGNFGADP
jgi:hypothetical protein